MTYTPEQARAMVRAAVRWAREMPEAGEEAIVERVLVEAGVTPSVPQWPPQVTGFMLRSIAGLLLNQAAFRRGQAVLMRVLGGTDGPLDIEADAYQALGEWVLEEARRREALAAPAQSEVANRG